MSVENVFRQPYDECGFVELLRAKLIEYGDLWWQALLELPEIPYGDIAFYTVECTPEEAAERYDMRTFAHLLGSEIDADNIESVEVFNLSADARVCRLFIAVTFFLPVSAGPIAGHPSVFHAGCLTALGMRLERMSFVGLYNSLTPNLAKMPGFCFCLDVDDAEKILLDEKKSE